MVRISVLAYSSVYIHELCVNRNALEMKAAFLFLILAHAQLSLDLRLSGGNHRKFALIQNVFPMMGICCVDERRRRHCYHGFAHEWAATTHANRIVGG